MPNDIKNLLDNIINDTNNSYPNQNHSNPIEYGVAQFDKGQFREKISMNVLKDIISAMMHDETKDLDGMIDESISQHIRDNYNGTCFGYLSQARDKCKSPLLGDVIQEIDDAVEDTADKVSDKKDDSVANDFDVKEMLKDVDNYDEFREKLKKQVSEQVVNDVAKVVTTSNDAPVFDDLDEKLADNPNDELDPTTESVILRMTSSIVVESAMNGKPIPTEEGINRAVVKFCLAKMDRLFKQRPKKYDIYTRYL